MKDKRVIRIQNPKLQKIRNEFRKLFDCWLDDEIYRIDEEMDSLKIDSEGRRVAIVDRDAETLKKYRKLQETVANLTALGNQSILRCHTCGRTDKDMQYNKGAMEWFCLDCTEKYKKMRNVLIAKKGRGEYLYDLEDDDFYDTFA